MRSLTPPQKMPKITEKTESTLARLGRLTVESGTTKDKGELKRKMILFECVASKNREPVAALIPCRVLEEVKDELHSILERTSAAGYQENEADALAVGELATDVGNAVIDYQVTSNLLITLEKQC